MIQIAKIPVVETFNGKQLTGLHRKNSRIVGKRKTDKKRSFSSRSVRIYEILIKIYVVINLMTLKESSAAINIGKVQSFH